MIPSSAIASPEKTIEPATDTLKRRKLSSARSMTTRDRSFEPSMNVSGFKEEEEFVSRDGARREGLDQSLGFILVASP